MITPAALSAGVFLPMDDNDLAKKKFPDEPGVYLFLNANRKVLYVGKATSLKNRVRSYFSRDLAATRGPHLAEMVRRAKSVRVIPTDSVLEALILEAHLIKRWKPVYNSREKDDKSFNYLLITEEAYPRVLVVRGKELAERFGPEQTRSVFGPFPKGETMKQALKIVRKIFPFRDTCVPHDRRRHSDILKNVGMSSRGRRGKMGKPCFNRQLGLCPGVCTGEISEREYGKNIRHLTLFLEGKKKKLMAVLEKEMRRHAARREFEAAGEAKRRLFALRHIEDVALIKDEYRAAAGAGGFRAEAYDVAHTSGREVVGVMVSIVDTLPDKQGYRTFRVRAASPGDDVGALVEVLRRRLAHEEWPLPKLIVVDGGTAQKNAAESVLKEFGYAIPVVGVVKDERHRPRRLLGRHDLVRLRETDILVGNAEAHRFALAYHRRRRERILR